MPNGMNYPTKWITNMTASKTTKAPKEITIKAPKIVTAWQGVCTTSKKSEDEIVKAIENLHSVLTLESRLSVADKKKFIKKLEDGGAVSSFIKASHVPAIPTWINFRKLHAGFKALPIAKQLSVAMASYDILGVGKGEQIKTLDALTKEISTIRKAKVAKAKEGSTTPKKAKTNADTLASILNYFTGLEIESLTEDEKDAIAEIHAVIENAMASA
jgi:hypothetical protein